MRIAALYDIHGNLPALEAVLGEIRGAGVDGLVVGGDVVPGPLCRGCIAALMELPLPVWFIRGNGEADVLSVLDGSPPARVPERFHDVLRWSAGELLPEQLEALRTWPSTLRLTAGPLGKILFCHATPRDDSEIFTRLTPEERLRPVFEGVGAAVVVCGHTHMPFRRAVGALTVVNPGSVGMPYGEPLACWAILGPGVELRRTAYDLPSAAERLAVPGYPGASLYDVSDPPAEAHMLELLEGASLR